MQIVKSRCYTSHDVTMVSSKFFHIRRLSEQRAGGTRLAACKCTALLLIHCSQSACNKGDFDIKKVLLFCSSLEQ